MQDISIDYLKAVVLETLLQVHLLWITPLQDTLFGSELVFALSIWSNQLLIECLIFYGHFSFP